MLWLRAHSSSGSQNICFDFQILDYESAYFNKQAESKPYHVGLPCLCGARDNNAALCYLQPNILIKSIRFSYHAKPESHETNKTTFNSDSRDDRISF